MRVLLPPGEWTPGQRVSLGQDESHHLRVRRARPDDPVDILDGTGLIGTGVLVRRGSDWMVDIRSAEREVRGPELTLAAAAGDRDRFSWMAEKAVELGVTAIVPLETEHTSGVATRLRAEHIGKLRRVVLEATKQCGAAWVPEVDPPVPLSRFVSRPTPGEGWLADAAGNAPPAVLDVSPVCVVVGPEGGFSADERVQLVAAGYQPMSLGPNTLRFETAALAAATLVTSARMRGQHG